MKRIGMRFVKLNTLLIVLSCVMMSAMAEDFLIVPTIDSTSYQLTIGLIDFPDNKTENAFLLDSSKGRGIKAFPGLLSGYLGEDGYPANREGTSMATLLFDSFPVNHSFFEHTDNWWFFDSTQCFATLQGNDFVLYRELGTSDIKKTPTLDHGQFLPFNTITPGVFSDIHTNTYGALGNELLDDDPRKGEQLYLVEKPNHYFGLTLDATFLFPTSGTDTHGEDLIASFTADDDLWVYIDGYLILDLGGIHSAIPGSINFSTGSVTYRGADGKDYTTKLYKLFYNRYKEQHPEARERDMQDYINNLFTENSHWQTVFKPDSTHTLKLIYLERGAGASNLSIQMNVPILKKETE